MASKGGKESIQCLKLKELHKKKLIHIEPLAHTSAGKDKTFKPATLHLVKILSSLGKSPCDYLAGTSCPPTCRLVTKGVSDKGKTWDIYLMNCHYPPCAFFERL